ncbi:hypothetical protein PVK06_047799 [Gossypium arboreum]|uniref:Uncharacterized protein n=1 Tax=Gossypium arboreum TaxID=29729 RepID=A0ABR0MEL9_GOSAR|nr:hypothetical protein PVK06_047799 [Gossypium arboreum]
MRQIDNLVEGDFIDGQATPNVEEKVHVGEEEVRAAFVNETNEDENIEKETTTNIVNAPKFVGATTDTLE